MVFHPVDIEPTPLHRSIHKRTRFQLESVDNVRIDPSFYLKIQLFLFII